LVGVGTAARTLGGLGKVPPALTTLTLLGALLAHVAVNVLNDYFDYRSGLDLRTRPTPFSGGSGVLPRGLMSPRGVLVMGIGSLLMVVAIGLWLLQLRGWGLLPVGLLGLLVVVLYTPWITKRPWACLIAPGLGFGPLVVMGTHYVLTGGYDWLALWASLVPGILVSNLLLLNQFPDLEADGFAGRRHLPLTIGRQASARLYAALAGAAFAWVALGVLLGVLPPGTLLALLPLPLVVATIRGVVRNAEHLETLLPWLGGNVIYTLAAPLLLGVGLLMW